MGIIDGVRAVGIRLAIRLIHTNDGETVAAVGQALPGGLGDTGRHIDALGGHHQRQQRHQHNYDQLSKHGGVTNITARQPSKPLQIEIVFQNRTTDTQRKTHSSSLRHTQQKTGAPPLGETFNIEGPQSIQLITTIPVEVEITVGCPITLSFPVFIPDSSRISLIRLLLISTPQQIILNSFIFLLEQLLNVVKKIREMKSGDIVFYFRDERHDFAKSVPVKAVAERISEIIMAETGQQCIDLVDFGGVAEHFLGGRGEEPYIENPPLIKEIPAFIFSFLPSNAKMEQAPIMNMTALKAGFMGTIITTKKEGKRGKGDLVQQFLFESRYYDDTLAILDGITSSKIHLVWVRPPPESEFSNGEPTNSLVSVMEIPEFLDCVLRR
jgi:hypothetical protein